MNQPRFESPIRAVIRRGWAFNPALSLAVIVNMCLIPLSLVLMVVAPVSITGVNGWIKPLKFGMSVVVYAGTLLWLLPLVERRQRTVQTLATSVGVILLVEIAIIVIQVIRGTTSHFNYTSALNIALYSTMGTLITILGLLNMAVAVWLLRQQIINPIMTTGLRWAVWLTTAGMFVAFLMTIPLPSTLTGGDAVTTGALEGIIGAHSVGVPDGGPGLPVVGWSTEGGDLRIPHFVGLHALQVLPLVAWILGRPGARRRWTDQQRTTLVHIGGSLYLGIFLLLTWQALRGQPLLAPDMITLATLALLIGAAAVAGLMALRSHVPHSRIAQG